MATRGGNVIIIRQARPKLRYGLAIDYGHNLTGCISALAVAQVKLIVILERKPPKPHMSRLYSRYVLYATT